jgi:hypothetical protein
MKIESDRGMAAASSEVIGVMVTRAEPTSAMISEVAAAGFVQKSAHGRLPRLQIVTIADLFEGRLPKLPPLPPPLSNTTRPKRRADTGQLPLFLTVPGSKTVREQGAFVDPRFIRFGQ